MHVSAERFAGMRVRRLSLSSVRCGPRPHLRLISASAVFFLLLEWIPCLPTGALLHMLSAA